MAQNKDQPMLCCVLLVSLLATVGTATNTCAGSCTPYMSTKAAGMASLRTALLAGYDSSVIPSPTTGALGVALSVNFLNFRDITLNNGRLELRVWYDMIWQDTRLQWVPTNYGNVTEIRFSAGAFGDIWSPDVGLVNMDEPLSSTLSNELAVVYNNGTVRWSRPGSFIAHCLFTHISAFPWDYPTCTMELGSWTHDTTDINLGAYGRGWTFGGLDSSDTFLLSSREFKFHRVDIQSTTYTSRGLHSNWKVIQYTVTLKRQTRLVFLAKTIIPHIILAVCSFSVFFMNPECHERLSLGLLLVLLELVCQLLFAPRIPYTGSWTALSKITTASFYLTLCTMFESCAVCCAYWFARTVRPKPATKPGFAAKFIAMWKIPTSKTGTQQDLPVLLKRQQTQAKLRTQIRAAGEQDTVEDYLRKDDREKRLLRQQIRERKIQNRIEEERVKLQERRYRFVASRIDLAASFCFPVTFIVVLFVLLAEIVVQVGTVKANNIDETVELGYVPATSAASIASASFGVLVSFVALHVCRDVV